VVRLRRASESQWRRRVLELATFLAEEALAPDLFERFLAMLGEDVPATSAVLDYDAHENRTEFVTWRLDASAMRAYSQHYHAINPFAHAILRHRLVNGTYIGSHLVDDKTYLRSEYYDGFVRPRGERYFLAISISHPDGGRTGIPLYRGDSEGGDFRREEVRRLEMLRPFLKTALLLRRLHRRYSLHNLPIVDGDPDADCDACNDAAEAFLSARRPGITRERLSLHPSSPSAQVILPRVSLDPAAIFRRRYGLSKRESEIAALLCDGLTYEEVASRLTISHHTVNGHVKSILRKLNVTSVRRLPPLLRDENV
jgi:DNA-binding CsgD family transcriptional regulator